MKFITFFSGPACADAEWIPARWCSCWAGYWLSWPNRGRNVQAGSMLFDKKNENQGWPPQSRAWPPPRCRGRFQTLGALPLDSFPASPIVPFSNYAVFSPPMPLFGKVTQSVREYAKLGYTTDALFQRSTLRMHAPGGDNRVYEVTRLFQVPH